MIIKHCRLENTTPPHNKFYELKIVKEDTIQVYCLYSKYGKIGVNGIEKLIFKDKALNLVEELYINQRNKKITSGGYTPVVTVESTESKVTLSSIGTIPNIILNKAIKNKQVILNKKKQFSIYSPGRMNIFV